MTTKRLARGRRPAAALWTLGLCLGLGACASYQWVHPKLPPRMADKARLQCEDEALKVYPVAITQDVAAGDSHTQGTQCAAKASEARCSGGGSHARTASTHSYDINQGPRRERIDTCMRAAGWTQVEVPRK